MTTLQPEAKCTECKSNPHLRPYNSWLNLDTVKYDKVVTKLIEFFKSKGFKHVYAENRYSILSACEDPFNISVENYLGLKWPKHQTGQMWLEWELLNFPERAPGYFCITNSYRLEPNPVPGRHYPSFPLFEFEMLGDMEALIDLELELLEYLGYDPSKFIRGKYDDVAKSYGVHELEHEHEERLYKERSPTFLLTDFPEHTDPFWNMKRSSDGTSKKVDVILSGQETIGSAQRESDPEVMLDRFKNICEGAYADKLLSEFDAERIMDIEMKDYLDLPFVTRSGGGIGVTRLIQSMEKEGLL